MNKIKLRNKRMVRVGLWYLLLALATERLWMRSLIATAIKDNGLPEFLASIWFNLLAVAFPLIVIWVDSRHKGKESFRYQFLMSYLMLVAGFSILVGFSIAIAIVTLGSLAIGLVGFMGYLIIKAISYLPSIPLDSIGNSLERVLKFLFWPSK